MGGNATLANAIGPGVADDKGVLAYTLVTTSLLPGRGAAAADLLSRLGARAMPRSDRRCCATSTATWSNRPEPRVGARSCDRTPRDRRGWGAGAQAYRHSAPAGFIAQPVFPLPATPMLTGEIARCHAGRAPLFDFCGLSCCSLAERPRAAGWRAYAGGAARGLAHRELFARLREQADPWVLGEEECCGALRFIVPGAARYLERAPMARAPGRCRTTICCSKAPPRAIQLWSCGPHHRRAGTVRDQAQPMPAKPR